MNIDPPLPGTPVLPYISRKRRPTARQNSITQQGGLPPTSFPQNGHEGPSHLPTIDAAPTTATNEFKERSALLQRLPTAVRGHVVAVIGEFIGTFLFLFFAFSGTQVALSSYPNFPQGPPRLLYVALSFGFSLAVNAWVFFRISGGLFNPAVTFALCFVGSLAYVRGMLVIVAQLIGAIAAAGVVSALFPGPLAVQTRLSDGTSIVRGLFIEMFLTAELVFTIFMLAAEKNRATFIAPVGIGLALFVAELSGVYFTGGSLNPARSFGPCVVDGSFDGYHWIYWLGPLLGALLASGFYKFIKVLEYETANPSPDYEGSIRGKVSEVNDNGAHV